MFEEWVGERRHFLIDLSQYEYCSLLILKTEICTGRNSLTVDGRSCPPPAPRICKDGLPRSLALKDLITGLRRRGVSLT